jgi:hypothetical protein
MTGVPTHAEDRFVPPTAEELVNFHIKVVELERTCDRRRASGKQTSGRYKKHDTARMHFLRSVVKPNLALGKLPTEREQYLLFEVPGIDEVHPGTSTKQITKAQKDEMDACSDTVKPQAGSKAAKRKLMVRFHICESPLDDTCICVRELIN